MLIVEIILTIVAWCKGWRGWAVIPAGLLFPVGFSIGLFLGAGGYSEAQIQEVTRFAVLLDVLAIGVLIWMTVRGRRGSLANGSTKELGSAQAVTSKI